MLTLTIIAAVVGYSDDGHMMWGNRAGWVWLWGTLMMLAVIAAIAVGAWLIIRSTRRPETTTGNRAREILAERYARGELSTEEYHERLNALRQPEPPT